MPDEVVRVADAGRVERERRVFSIGVVLAPGVEGEGVQRPRAELGRVQAQDGGAEQVLLAVAPGEIGVPQAAGRGLTEVDRAVGAEHRLIRDVVAHRAGQVDDAVLHVLRFGPVSSVTFPVQSGILPGRRGTRDPEHEVIGGGRRVKGQPRDEAWARRRRT